MASVQQKGFTLIETLVVIGILAAIAGMSAFIGIDAIARGTVARERDTLVSLLTGARARALANVNESAHGVHIGADAFIVFEGPDFASSDPAKRSPVPRTDAVSVDPEDIDIIFAALSGGSSDEVVQLTDAQGEATVEINDAGGIEW